jgi:hypothetical protein
MECVPTAVRVFSLATSATSVGDQVGNGVGCPDVLVVAGREAESGVDGKVEGGAFDAGLLHVLILGTLGHEDGDLGRRGRDSRIAFRQRQ